MRCPFCGHEDSQVKDSRPSEDNSAIRRRRPCPDGSSWSAARMPCGSRGAIASVSPGVTARSPSPPVTNPCPDTTVMNTLDSLVCVATCCPGERRNSTRNRWNAFEADRGEAGLG